MAILHDAPDAAREHRLPEALAELAQPRALRAGGLVFRQGEAACHVFFLRHGRIVLNRFGPDGEQAVIHTARGGEFFAEAAAHAGHYHCTAEAADDSVVEAIDSAGLRRRLAEDPGFAVQWSRILSRQLRQARTRLERLSLRRASERLRHLLLTEGHGSPPAFTLDGTLRELAAELGLSHESLYRTMAALERDGVLERRSRQLILLR
jgi:CRP-like cAMP-binding protein